MKKNLFIFLLTILLFIPIINIKADGTYEIYVRPSNGVNQTYEVSPLTTVLELKNLIAAETNIPAERQRLIFAGTTLEDDRTIASYNIQLEATIHLIAQVELTFDKKIAGDDTDIDTTLINANTIYDPETPTRSGYTFDGWYEDGSVESFDFENTAINSDKTFYAKWIKDEEETTTTETTTKTNKEETTNPKTSDSIIIYLSTLIISVIGLIISKKITRLS